MSDRIKSITVVTTDMAVEDAEALLSAIRLLRGVISADAMVKDQSDYAALSTARNELRAKLLRVLG